MGFWGWDFESAKERGCGCGARTWERQIRRLRPKVRGSLVTRRRNGTQERLPALRRDQRRPWPLGSPPASLVLGRLVSSLPDSPPCP